MSEPTHRALLIGVPAYEDRAIDDLPFIEDDLGELAQALKGNGYEVAIHDPARTDRDAMDLAVETFFLDALPGQTLLLFLSGHGIHHQDTDYLVPRGASTRSSRFTERCLSLDFGTYAENSRAGDVVVFIDACREGIHVQEKSAGQILNWSDMEVRRAGERRFCYVYACTKGEAARYATTGTTTFSLFSRALSSLIAAETGPGTLDEVRDGLQAALAELCSEHGLPLQHVRVGTETDLDFVLFPRPERAAALAPGEHPWLALARDHPAWPLVADGPGAQLLQEATTALVGHLAQCDAADARLLAADPWRSSGLAERFTERVSWLLVNMLNEPKLQLTPAEAALLVAVPFLHVAYGNRAVARALSVEPLRLGPVEGASKERAEYEQFVTGHARLVRRATRAAETGDGAGAAGIAWWLLRRWATRRPATGPPASGTAGHGGAAGPEGPDGLLAELLVPVAGRSPRLVGEVFAPKPLLTLARGLASSPDLAAERPERQLAGSSGVEQRVRDQLLLALLTVAHRMAIDPATLPEVVVDHIGIRYSVGLPALHATVERARWDPRGRSRVLHAVCEHPAVGLALEQLAHSVDRVLGTIDVLAGSAPQLVPLEDLPAHATADQVLAATTAEGTRAYESTDLRFRLADDRVQELLMGEQLYGDPALAIRELYQNALDACRYRDARTRYLRAKQRYPEGSWAGRIAFTQGVDADGRAYIECADNGIGMGERELRDVFAHAGMRFADLPEYVEERAAWRTEGIEIHPNSRFGIGVLSYFMLADDITVTTCRLDREGHPGRRLRVDIAGPGALFRVEDEGRGFEAGTAVRLYVRDAERAPSCVDLLGRLLWIAEHEVTAEDLKGKAGAARGPLRWEPGVLSEVAPVGSHNPHDARAERRPGVRCVRTSRPSVWWSSEDGAVLADGLWIGVTLHGAVVDLTGPYAPQLSVHRNQCLSFDQGRVIELLREEMDSAVRSGEGLVTQTWLVNMALLDRSLADGLAERVCADESRRWTMHGFEGAASVLGCFPADAALFRRSGAVPWPVLRTEPRGEPRSALLEWRIRAWIGAGAYPGLSLRDPDGTPVARPADLFYAVAPAAAATDMLRSVERGEPDAGGIGLWKETQRGMGHVFEIADRLGVPPGEVAARLAELGMPLQDGVSVPDAVRPTDKTLLTRGGGAGYGFLDVGERAPLGHVLRAARLTGMAVTDVAALLERYGHRVESDVVPTVVPADEFLLGPVEDFSQSDWLDPRQTVRLGRVLQIATRTGRRPDEVADRLRELGHRLDPGCVYPDRVRPGDVDLLKDDRWRNSGGLSSADMVSAAYVEERERSTGLAAQEIRARLTAFGYRLQGAAVDPAETDAEDRLLLSRHLNGSERWISPEERVPLTHILGAADASGLRPVDVARRLGDLGYLAPLPEAVPDESRPGDRELFGMTTLWLWHAEQSVSLRDVVRAARRAERGPSGTARRLREVGLLPPGAEVVADTVEDGDEALFEEPDFIREVPFHGGEPLSLGHVVAAAERTGRSPAQVAARLAAYGCRLAEGTALPGDVRPGDAELLRDGRSWLDTSRPVPLTHLIRAATSAKRPPAEVAHRLSALGCRLPDDILFEPPTPQRAATEQ